MLALKKAQIEQTIHEEIARLRTVESRLRHINDDGEMKDFDVVVKSIPARSYFSLRETLANIYDSLSIIHEMSRLLPAQVKEKDLGHFTVVLHDESFDIENTNVEMGFLLNRPSQKQLKLPSGREMKVRELAAIPTAVTAVRLGAFINNHLTYGALGTWVESNGYHFDGPPREVFIVPPTPGREEDAVVEVQFPVRPQLEADLALIP